MLTANEIMTQDVVVIRDSANVAQAIALMQNQKVRSLIVEHVDTNRAYGIITERDIIYKVVATGKDPKQVGVEEIVREPCITIEPHLTIAEIAQMFADTGIQRAPVIQNGQLVGVVSVTDIIMKAIAPPTAAADSLTQQIQEALQHARIICGDEQSRISQECAVVWDVVEELQAARQHSG